MLLIGTRNSTSQSVLTGGTINLGEVYRKYCKKNSSGVKAFDFNSTSISLQHSGIYHITANVTFTAPTAGVVVFQLTENGVALPSALASETITTAATEVKTTTIDYYVIVDSACVLGCPTTVIKNIGILNTGVGATISNVVVNVDKVA